jgi:glutathione peroxidase
MNKTTLIIILTISALVGIVVAITHKNSKEMTFKQRILKTMYPMVMRMSKKEKQEAIISNAPIDFYGNSITLNNGSALNLSVYKGKKILIVNTASNCGFTRQYESLEKLYNKYKDSSLVLIAFPSNDFGEQEKGSDETIAQFCKKNYGISFPIAKKGVVVKTEEQQQLYKWLTHKEMNGWNEKEPSWNFCKYIINEKGELTHFFNSSVEPLGEEIEKALWGR